MHKLLLRSLTFSLLVTLPLVAQTDMTPPDASMSMETQTITYDDQLNLVAPTSSGETGLFTALTGDTLKARDWSFSVYYNNYDYLLASGRDLPGRPRN